MRNPTQKSAAFKERLRIGREIASQLDEHMTVAEVAAETGLSKQYIRRTECLALAKLAILLRAAMRAGEFEQPVNPGSLSNMQRKGWA